MRAPDEAGTSKTVVLVAITISSFLAPMALSSVNVALPTMAKELAMDALSLSWVATAYMVAAAMFLVPLGRLADIVGRKKIFLIGTGVFTGASFLLGLAPSTGFLIAFRAIQGVGGSMIFGTGIAILTSVYPAAERGRVFGINIAAVYLGLSAGPFLGGLFTQYVGWRSVFFMNVPLGIAILCFCVWKLREEWAHAKGEEFDFIGSLIYSSMLISIMYGFSLLPATRALLFIIPGLAATAAFVLWELRTKSPIINVTIFMKNKVFTLSNVAALISYSATYAVGFLLSLYLQQIKGLSPLSAGIILVPQPIVQALLSPLAGRVSDRIEPRLVASTGMAVTAVGLFFLAFIEATTPMWFIIGNLIVLGLGFALFSSPNTNAIMGSVETRFYGVASSILSTMRLLGQMFSMGIVMLLFAVYMGRVAMVPAHNPLLMKSVRVAFLIFGFMCVAAIYASFARGNVRLNKESSAAL
jgi:EmrB/QacA subfamily drug resistance transporter